MSNSHTKSPREILSLLDDGHLTPEATFAYLQYLQANSRPSFEKQDETLQKFLEDLRAATSQPRSWGEVSSQFQLEVLAKIRQLSAMETIEIDQSNRPTNELNRGGLNGEPSALANTELRNPPNQVAETSLPEFLAPPEGPNEIGRLGSYRILRKIGEGGMGIVFEAQDTRLQRRVAIKTMLPRLATDSNCRLRFLQEAQAAARVEHDFLCPIFQVGEHDGVPFIAMPFLLGETLEAAMQRVQITLSSTIRIGIEISRGLAAAHSANLIHRDIKPGNIWLEQRSDNVASTVRVKILDFGLARIVSDETQLTQTGAILGTPSYMSPEQARSQPVDSRSDLYSLGTVMYEMLTHKRPFVGDSPLSVMTSLIIDHPKPPIEIEESIPVALSQLVMELLSKSPSDRPQTAKLVAERLQSILEQLPESRPPTVVNPAISPPLRAKRFWSVFVPVVAIGFLGFISVAGVMIFQNHNGTLKIVYEGDADVRLHEGEIQIYNSRNSLKYTLTPSEKNRALPPGAYRVKVVGTDGVKLETESFEMAEAGVFTLRVTVKPTDSTEDDLAKIESLTPILLDERYFPGTLVLAENFMNATGCSVPILANQKVDTHRFIALKPDCKANDVLPLFLGPELESGACLIRCRSLNSRVFLNFAIRNSGDKNRWLGLNNPRPGQWQINVHRRDRENGIWTEKPMIRAAERFTVNTDLSLGKWVDFAVGWSPLNYDAWIDGLYVGGGKLPSEELTIGKPMALQLCAGAVAAGDIQLEIDFIGMWDQSALNGSIALPAALSRTKY